MVATIERLKHASLAALDTCLFIYHFEANPIYQNIAGEILHSVEAGSIQAVTSLITLMEITVRPLALNRVDVARKYEILLSNFPNLTLAALDRESVHKAAYLRAQYRIRPAVALQIAACIQHGADIFITNDQRLEKVNSEIEILLLSDNI